MTVNDLRYVVQQMNQIQLKRSSKKIQVKVPPILSWQSHFQTFTLERCMIPPFRPIWLQCSSSTSLFRYVFSKGVYNTSTSPTNLQLPYRALTATIKRLQKFHFQLRTSSGKFFNSDFTRSWSESAREEHAAWSDEMLKYFRKHLWAKVQMAAKGNAGTRDKSWEWGRLWSERIFRDVVINVIDLVLRQ